MLLPRTKESFFQRRTGRNVEGIAVYHNPLSDIGGDRLKEMDKICKMEAEEVRYAKQLRSENMQKDQRADSVYCYCRQPESGYMVQCELCYEWYHATCLHALEGKRIPKKNLRFLCAVCERTRRPSLGAIVSLLISLQNIPVAISEGTALHCLAERAIGWQRKAKKALSKSTVILEAAKRQNKLIADLKAHVKWSKIEVAAKRDTSDSNEPQSSSSAGEERGSNVWETCYAL